jgi:histidinol-phosphate/aromatic aminotransferase/cobyric acid decarboxylase-like protein
MTEALERAFREAQRLPEREQEEIAALIEQKLADLRWDELFAQPGSDQILRKLAHETCREDDAGLARADGWKSCGFRRRRG